MFGRRTIHDEYAKTIREIREGRRREPKHDWPETLLGKQKARYFHPFDEIIFDEFAWFGATLDWETDDKWSMEETSDTGLRSWHHIDMPAYGRRWTIYYNALEIGWLETYWGTRPPAKNVEEFRANPSARIDMELNLMRFIHPENAFSLLRKTSYLMQGVEDGYEAASARARQAAESAMIQYMWEVMRIGDEFVPQLRFSAEGPYGVYRKQVEFWVEGGHDPFTLLARRSG